MKLSLCTLMFSVACMPAASPETSRHQFNVYIQPGFTEPQKQSVINALAEWEVNTDQVVSFQEVYFEDRSKPLIIVIPSTRNAISKRHHNDFFIGYYETCGNDRCVEVAFNLSSIDLHKVALHEVGHSLGLTHDKNMKHRIQTVMSEDVYDSSDFLTCRDMQQFCGIWHCNASQLPLCKTFPFKD